MINNAPEPLRDQNNVITHVIGSGVDVTSVRRLIGMVFLNPLLGVALGAGAGALSGALTDFGIRDQFMKDLAAKVKSGDAVLFLLIKTMTADKVLNEIKDAGGTVLKTSLDEKKEQYLRDTLAAATQPKAA